MRKRTLALSTVALAFSGAAFAQAPHAGHKMPRADMTRAQAQQQAGAMFAKMDANGDGVLNEADRGAMQTRMFDRLDANRDGQITRAELDAARPGKPGERRAAAGKPAPTEAQMAERRAEMFARVDTDKNGTVSRAEFDAMGAKMGGKAGGKMGRKGMAAAGGSLTRQAFVDRALAMFDKADTDRNGTVTVAERQAAAQAMRQQWQARKAAGQQG